MVEFTYQDYLKYEKFLERDEQKKKENKLGKFTDKDAERYAKLLMKLEKILDDEYTYEEKSEDKTIHNLMAMEESTPYGEENKIKKKQEESRKKHDELFRSLLNDKEELISFIKYFVNPETNLTKEKLQKYNRSFVTERFKSRTSDIVYKEKDKNIYYLIEHQSNIDYDMPYRMLEYCYEIIRDTVDKEKIKNKNYEYPKVIPIVLYTGNKKWKVPKVIGLISDGSYKNVGLSLKYLLIDTNDYNKEQLLNSESMVGYAMIADRSNTNEEVAEAIEKMLIEKPNKREEILGIMDYIFADSLNLDKNEGMKEIITNGEVKEVMITVRERLAENNKKIMKDEIAQGITNGINKILLEMAKNMLNLGMKKEDIQKVTGLSNKKIEEIIKENENKI